MKRVRRGPGDKRERARPEPAARPPRAAFVAWPWLAPVLAALAGLLLHVRALSSPFFADDWLFLDLVRSRSLWGALSAHDPIGNFFRPLGRAGWFWTLAHASGESAVAFHAANALLFVACVALTWWLVRAVADARTAAIAAALLALTPAADVPVRWASGSQDLLALALALAGMLAFVRGRRAVAVVLFVLAPLAKEVVAFACVPAALLARRRGEPWRATLVRAWPCGVSLAVYGTIAAVAAAQRHGASPLSFSPAAPFIALLGALRVLLGVEWSTGDAPVLPFALAAWAGIALAAGAVAAAATQRRSKAREGAAPETHAAPHDLARAAAAWVLVGALPIALVAPIWSAYFYLFAAGGMALLAGVVLAGRPLAVVVPVVLLLGGLERRAAGLREFATSPGALSPQSHVNDFYLERGMSVVARAIADLKRLHPAVPARSTFYFAGVPSFAGVQAADGPLVRSVYRDSSLRSYYLTDLTLARMQRGPGWFMFYSPGDGVFNDESDSPDLFLRIALGMILNGREDSAREAMEVGRQRGAVSETSHYLAAFMALEAGERDSAYARLRAAGCEITDRGDTLVRAGEVRAAAGDTAGAMKLLAEGMSRCPLDPRVHALLADLQLRTLERRKNAAFEAYVARVLAPNDGMAWRRWAFSLFWNSRFDKARPALERYFELSPLAAAHDAEALELRQRLPRMLPGGDLMQQALQREASR